MHKYWHGFLFYDTINGIICASTRSCSHAAWQRARCAVLRMSSRRTVPSNSWRKDVIAWRGRSARILSEEMQTPLHIRSPLNELDILSEANNYSFPFSSCILHTVLFPLKHTCLSAPNLPTCRLTNHNFCLTGIASSWHLFSWPSHTFIRRWGLSWLPGLTICTTKLIIGWLSDLPSVSFCLPIRVHYY